MNQGPESTYIGYEYKAISVPSKDASLFLDCYENFGWIPDENHPTDHSGENTTIHLKRNRKIINKMELTRLQRNFESCNAEIQQMERSKKQNCNRVGYGYRVYGYGFYGGFCFCDYK